MNIKTMSCTVLIASLLMSSASCRLWPPKEKTPAIEIPEGWQLSWHDEFDGQKIDPDIWAYDLGAGGWGNGEAQYYTDRPENARLENGMLLIEARAEKYEGAYYTSARLKTQGLRESLYGRIEARIKVPSGLGTWPAFWMLGSDFNGTNWPDCGEIDIMEHVGKEPDLIMGTVHGPGYSGVSGRSQWNRQKYNIADDFHTYSIEWEEDQIRWYFDDAEYFKISRSDLNGQKWVFNHSFFVILNLALGGTFPGPIALNTEFPAQMHVDYIRVYQK